MVFEHYGGGGKPKPEEQRRATVSFTCSQCDGHVSPDDRKCKHCGEPFCGFAVFDKDKEQL